MLYINSLVREVAEHQKLFIQKQFYRIFPPKLLHNIRVCVLKNGFKIRFLKLYKMQHWKNPATSVLYKFPSGKFFLNCRGKCLY